MACTNYIDYTYCTGCTRLYPVVPGCTCNNKKYKIYYSINFISKIL